LKRREWPHQRIGEPQVLLYFASAMFLSYTYKIQQYLWLTNSLMPEEEESVEVVDIISSAKTMHGFFM
jgi:hypothetical protein